MTGSDGDTNIHFLEGVPLVWGAGHNKLLHSGSDNDKDEDKEMIKNDHNGNKTWVFAGPYNPLVPAFCNT